MNKYIKIPDSDAFMCEAPVTQAEYEKVMGVNPSYFKNQPNNPVETVSYFDVLEFIKKLNASQEEYIYRLPTEKEWEACAKPCDDQNKDDIAWHYGNSGNTTHPVKTKLPNSLGFYDLLGNVWEWVNG